MKGFPEPRHRGRSNKQLCFMARLSFAVVPQGRMSVWEDGPEDALNPARLGRKARRRH
jgi:hypothetical protein